MKKFCLAAIAAVTMLSGCAGQNVLESGATHVVVRAGIAEFIGRDAAVAQEVIDWTDEVIALLDGDADILLTAVRDQAMKLIPWNDLSPGRYVLAVETLAFVEDYVATRIAQGDLPAEATMSIRELLESARWSAELQLGMAQQ